MKKYLHLTALILFASISALAQNTSKADAILASLNKQYAGSNVIKADFKYTLKPKAAGTAQSTTGTIYAQPKTNSFKLITKAQDIISNGKQQWTYLKEEDEVQLSNAGNSADDINPAQLFNFNKNTYIRKYAGLQGGRHVVDLQPLSKKGNLVRIRLFVDKTATALNSAVITDKSGNTHQYTISNFNANYKAPQGLFNFDTKKHPGVELVDLR